MTGATDSANFPVTPGAFDETFNGGVDIVVLKLNVDGSALHYSGFLGGSGVELGRGLALDTVGGIYVTGETSSPNFPTTANAFDTTLSGFFDAFVAKFNPTGSMLDYATYVGGSSDDVGFNAWYVGGLEQIHLTGGTNSNDFPVTSDAFDVTFNGAVDGYVLTLKPIIPLSSDAEASALLYSTYLGGSGYDVGSDIALDAGGGIYVTGVTFSTDFPTTPGAFDTTFNGGGDLFVTKFGPAAGKPDLVVTAVSNPPAVVVLKQKISITDSTKNQGSANAVATATRYYLSTDAVRNAGDKLLAGKRSVPALDAGITSTGTAQATVPANTKLGTYFLLACADDQKVQAESDETNNCRASSTTVEVRAPDLVETAISDPPPAASPGGSFSVTDTVENRGNASAGPSTTRFDGLGDSNALIHDRVGQLLPVGLQRRLEKSARKQREEQLQALGDESPSHSVTRPLETVR